MLDLYTEGLVNVFGFHRINKQGLMLKIVKNEMHNASVSTCSRSDTGV